MEREPTATPTAMPAMAPLLRPPEELLLLLSLSDLELVSEEGSSNSSEVTLKHGVWMSKSATSTKVFVSLAQLDWYIRAREEGRKQGGRRKGHTTSAQA